MTKKRSTRRATPTVAPREFKECFVVIAVPNQTTANGDIFTEEALRNAAWEGRRTGLVYDEKHRRLTVRKFKLEQAERFMQLFGVENSSNAAEGKIG